MNIPENDNSIGKMGWSWPWGEHCVVSQDLFPNPGATVGKLWESAGGKGVSFGFGGVSGFGIPEISSGRRRIPSQVFLGEDSGVLRLGLDFPVGNSQQSTFLS